MYCRASSILLPRGFPAGAGQRTLPDAVDEVGSGILMMQYVRHRTMTTTKSGRWMQRIVRAAASAVTLVASPLWAATTPGAAPSPPAHPNIVLFLMDDLGYGDIEPFGSPFNHTPCLNRMAEEGMRLTSFYACPVCTPSRAQIMTGCYAQRVSLPKVLMPGSDVGLNPAEHTVAQLLKARGYATMCIGKWHLGDQSEFLPTRFGFDHYFGLPYSNDMGGREESSATRSGPATLPARHAPPLPLMRDETVAETLTPTQQDFLTVRYTQEAVKFIADNRQHPFFLYLAHTAVHRPHHPGAQYVGKSGHGVYNDWILESDWSLGQVLDALRQQGLAQNTLVIFTSDNGGQLPEARNLPFSGGKMTTREGGMREPTIAWWPGYIAPGTNCDALTVNFDLLPTFVHLAGGEVPTDRKIDGADLWPLLSSASAQSPHEALFYFRRYDLQAVRSGVWKLVLKDLAPVALYELDHDPAESTDVSAQHPEIVQRLKTLATAAQKELGDPAAPGVRPPGHVQAPQYLRLAPGH